ncbi:MAG: BlaI/MecI/CopY family transcriptional regulator [Firmicutes bacterium]|nr:BlaI/MecI/CopY family transcriptional regulator [Bacillota bacterium]
MEDKRLSHGEWSFMDIIWNHEPVGSGRLVELCREQLGWAKSTTYTRLRILTQKGYAENTASTVRSLISREEAQARESSQVVKEAFKGSLPSFLTSFLEGRAITEKEAAELKRLIDFYKEG